MLVLLVDSRERAPLIFGCDWERKGLKVGDYCARFSPSYQYPLVFERKSINDLFGSLTQSYDRFRRMLLRAEKLGIRVVIAIEGTKEKVLKGCSHSARDPESILVQLETIKKKYNVEYIFFPSRIAMQHYIVDYYLTRYEEYLELTSTAERSARKPDHGRAVLLDAEQKLKKVKNL